jgi:hypothetical protein
VDISKLHQSMVMHDSDFVKMRSRSYTGLTEHSGNERSIIHNGKTVEFRKGAGQPISPIEGLAATLAKGNDAYSVILR